jgi:hypothetical protein
MKSTHDKAAMTTQRWVLAGAAAVLLGGLSPAAAGDHWRHRHGERYATRHAIYELENRIAFLEANPEIDDGYKGPIITQARADILRLRAGLRPATWRWASPCCYSRRPIHIR